MSKEELIGIEEAKQVNSDRMSLVKQLMDKNRELQDIINKQKEEIAYLKSLACWNEFVHLVKSKEYKPIKYVPKRELIVNNKQEEMFTRCYGACLRGLDTLPDKQWFIENNLEEIIKGVGYHMDLYIKTHIDILYDSLSRTWDRQKEWFQKYRVIRYDLI